MSHHPYCEHPESPEADCHLCERLRIKYGENPPPTVTDQSTIQEFIAMRTTMKDPEQ